MLPPSVSLHQWDVKTDVSEHLMGVYDVVHLRFFAFVIQEYELDAILERLLKLLSQCSLYFTGRLKDSLTELLQSLGIYPMDRH